MMNRFWRSLTILVLSLTLSTNLLADEPAISQLHNEYDIEKIFELKERFKFTSLVLKVGSEIDEKIQTEFKSNENPVEHTKRLARILDESMGSYEEFYTEHLKLDRYQSKKFRDYFRNIEWENVISTFKKTHLGIEVFFKKNGIGLGLAVICGALTEYIVPTILIHIGLAKLIPLSVMTPWSAMYSLIPNLMYKAKVNSLMEETLGTKDRVKFYKSQLEEIAHVFQQENPDFYLIPISTAENSDEIKTLIVHQEPKWKRLFPFIRNRSKDLNFGTLKNFLNENHVDVPYINWVLSHKKIDNELKVAMIANHFYATPESEILELFEKRFAEKVKMIRDVPNPEKLWLWIKAMKNVRTFDELMTTGLRYEGSMSPVLMAQLWEDILMPNYIEKLNIGYSEARDMQLQFEVFKARTISLKSEWPTLSPYERRLKLHHEVSFFIQRLGKGKGFKGCQKTNLEVLNFLLPKT